MLFPFTSLWVVFQAVRIHELTPIPGGKSASEHTAESSY
jgi:hypothetical protein